jgi:hypothetical protein
MTFDVSKFLALTALLAGAGVGTAACSSDSNDGAASGGTGGKGGTASGGSNSHAGSSSDNQGGHGGQVPEGGAAGSLNGAGEGGAAAGAGGAAGGSVGGAGGATGEAGAGGATECFAHDPSYENDPCADLPVTDCDAATEGLLNPYYDTCSKSGNANSAARIKYADCVLAEDANECDVGAPQVAADCWAEAVVNLCPVEGAATACAAVVGTCSTGLSADTCTKMLNTLAVPDDAYITSCMDPAGEFFDELFEGDCKARLAACSYVPAL